MQAQSPAHPAPHPAPTAAPQSAHLALMHRIDAAHRAELARESLDALVDLMMVQHTVSTENLSHVSRNGLAGLLSLVSQEIGRELKEAGAQA